MSGKRKYSCDYNYFDCIDSEEKAYWLGFIMADGCVCMHKNIRHLKTCDSVQVRKYLQISISHKDFTHLQKFSKSINSTYPIHTYITSSGFKENYEYCRIIIEDAKIFDDLNKYGVLCNKELNEIYPSNLESSFDLAFIRGFFDGDGCLSVHKSRYGAPEYEFNFKGTKEILTTIANKLNLTVTDKRLRPRFPERHTNNFTMKFCGNLQSFKVMNMLYGNANIYLDRKYIKYKELCDYLDSRSI